ncbi:MAG TPA: ABC transporter permease [Candidatus Limnocylindrales bacterium]|nr:ABC transporter permease [Candidatus Limnocylindrales bacterium]
MANREEKLEKELQFHIDQRVADLAAQGVAPSDALRQARMEIGGPEQVKEACRDVRPGRWLEDAWQDAEYALRALRKKPGFAAVALLTLALGIGASTIIFTVVDGVLLKPLAYPHPEQLLSVNGRSPGWNSAVFGEQKLAYPDFRDFQREIKAVDLGGWVWDSATLSRPGEPESVVVARASADLFSVLGVPLAAGRAFTAAEDAPGGPPVAIIGYSKWQERFAGSASAVGSSIVIGGEQRTIVGIANQALRIEDQEVDVFTPVGQYTLPFMLGRRAHPVGTIARLHPGASLAAVQQQFAAVGQRLSVQYPNTNKLRTFHAVPLRPDVSGVQSTLWLLIGAVGLVLAIACANVASLLVSRAVSRERELALRVALGAGRGRLVRQLLTESAVLSLAGGVLGIALAAIGIKPFVALWPGSLPRAEEVSLNWTVLLFAFGISLLTGLLFGLAPALRVHRLHIGGRTVGGAPKRLHGIFVAAEIAIAMVLLVAAGVLGRTMMRLARLDTGLDSHNVLTGRIGLSAGTLANPAQTRAAWDEILASARRVPGVESAALVDTVPMRQGNNQVGYWTNASLPPENERPLALATSATPDYLAVTGIRLLEGRFFDSRDRLGSESVVVVDDVLAREAFPHEDAIGKHLWIGIGSDPARVIGVVGHVRHWGLATDDAARVRSQFYYPFAQVPDPLVRRWSELMSLAVRTRVAPLAVVTPLRRAIRGAGGDQVLYEVRTMEQLASGSLSRQRFLLVLFGVFAALAMVLACIGIYGVLAYLTGLRVPEFGVRMALGATGSEVMRLVLCQSLGMVAIGVVLGVAGALAASRALARLVDGVRSVEIGTVAAMAGVLALAALCASLIPARRASRVDPVTALRSE